MKTANVPRNRTDTNGKRQSQWTRTLNVGTWNVLSWHRTGASIHAVQQLENVGMDITAIQEVRWLDTGNIRIGKSVIFYSGNQTGKHEFGTGFVIGEKYLNNVISFMPISERLCYIRLKGEWYNISIISAHAPTEDKEETIKDDFYEQLERTLEKIPKQDLQIICGDFNAQIGKEPNLRPTIGHHSLHNISNDNGQRLIELASANNMLVKSTMFQHKDIHKQTWVSNDNITRNQIDHIVVDARHGSNVLDVRSLRGVDGDTDHYLVRAKIKMRISSQKLTTNEALGQWNIEKMQKKENRESYEQEMNQQLKKIDQNNDVESLWEQMEGTIINTAKLAIGKSRKRLRKWFDKECEEKLQDRQKKRNIMIQQETTENKESYITSRRETRKLIRQKKREYEKQQYEEMERNRQESNSRGFYKSVSKEKKGFSPNSVFTLTKNNGELIINEEEILQKWREYFQGLLNIHHEEEHGENIYIGVDLPVEDPTIEETVQAINKLKNAKSPGSDNIPSEFLKYGGEVLHRQLHTLITLIWKEEKIPAKWHESIIIPIHKKGNKNKCSNYRGISLLNTAYKILSNILLSRLTPFVENFLGEYQAGFRKNRSTIDQIFTLRQLLEKGWEFNRTIHNLFIDFRQAYDSIKRDQLWNAMAEFSIPKKLIHLTKLCMNGCKARVRVGNQLSESFGINSGLKQGDALSPLLFNIILEKVVRTAQVRTELLTVNGPKLLLAYADDIDIVENTVPNVKETFNKIEIEAKKTGLEVNEEKTKYMCVNRQKNRDRIGQNVTIDTYNFERVQSFKYLGATITADNDITEEIKGRIQAANRCMYSLNNAIKSKTLTRTSKIRIYRTVIRPVLMYGCETWTLTKAMEVKLRCFERRILRKIFGPYHDPNTNQYRIRTNAEVKQIYNASDIVQEIKSQRLRWAGHVHRLPNNRLTKLIWEEAPTGKRPLGRPRMRWRDNLWSDLRTLGLPTDPNIMDDRVRWKQVVQSAKTHPGL